MHRVLIESQAIKGRSISIRDPRVIHHLCRVLRVRPGEPLECFDGGGRVYSGPITSCGRGELTMAIERQAEEPPPRVPVTLAQALIKPEPFEWVMQKATELGVARVIPMVTSRCAVRSAARDTQRMARWRRIIEAAAIQCGRATLPVLEPPSRFEEVVSAPGTRQALLLTPAKEGVLLRRRIRGLRDGAEVMVLIGPEGDFTPEEIALAERRGARAVTLGRLTLRSETAAVAALAVVQHTLDAL